MTTYFYTIEGTDRVDNPWFTTGEVSGDFMSCLELAFRDSFQQLTHGKAIYGNPGVGCRGPYKVTRYLLTGEVPQVPSGFLEVGTSHDGREVIVNHPRLQTDGHGCGHIVFSPAEARSLAALLLKYADACK